MEELEEAMLAVGAWLSKINDSCGVIYDIAFGINSFSIALHVKLLDVRSEFAEGLAIRNDGSCGVALDRSSEET